MVAAADIRAVAKTVIEMPTPTLLNGLPVDWAPSSVTRSAAGFFVLAMWPQGAASATDVTYFRGVPAQLESFSFIDPFTYGSAQITFPQITIFDDLDALGFLGTEDNPANVDIWWFPAVAGADFRNPITGAVDLTYGTGEKLWEGFIASRDLSDNGLSVGCQGALFQADYYRQKPFYPKRPFVMERLIFEVLHPEYGPGNQDHWMGKPHLRVQPMTFRFPPGWSKITPPREPGEPTLYTPVIPPNRLWTGYTTRNTGGWENTLTGYIQEILAVLYTTDDSGVPAGNQWTLRCETNRAPVLEIRDRARPPDFELWVGQPGVGFDGSEDFTTIENSLYGEGVGVDGVNWANAFVTGAWNRTDYEPLAANAKAHPPVAAQNPGLDLNFMVHESKANYGSGMSLEAAETASVKRLAIAQDAGITGTLTLSVDPAPFTRWHVRAGMTVKLKGLRGSGATGISFHIAEAVHNVASGVVTCKLDTKYRDLLTLEEVRARTIDPLSPSKLLQVNKRTNVIEDVLAPWDYDKGSGYIPMTARKGKNSKEGIFARYNFFGGIPVADSRFPWQSWTTNATKRPSYFKSSLGITGRPDENEWLCGPYAWVDANNAASRERWSVVPVLTAQKATIRLIEMAAYDSSGNVLAIPFHVSFYYGKPTPVVDYMPNTGSDYSPFTAGHFQKYSATGVPTPNEAPPDLMLVGWGNSDQRAGHSPGLSSEGFPATGLLVDEATWEIDSTTPELVNWDWGDAENGEDQSREAVTIWCAIYAEYTQDVFFLGRIYKQEQA